MAADTLSPRALREMKADGGAARYRPWPPEGYVAPTAQEFAELLRLARGHATAPAFRAQWERLDDAVVLRRAQLCELSSTVFTGPDANAVYGYTRALRDELRRRGVTFRSIALPRCQSCSHATERLFEATQATHPGLENQHGQPVASAFYCARCWSGFTLGDLADGLDRDDEDETEDEG